MARLRAGLGRAHQSCFEGSLRNIKRMLILRAKIDRIRRILGDGNLAEGQMHELRTAIRRFKVMYNSTGFCEHQTTIRKKIGGVRDEDRMLKLDATTIEFVTSCVSEVLNESHLCFTGETSTLFDSCKVFQRVRLRGERRWVNIVEPERWKETLDKEHSDHGHPGRSTFWPLIQSKFANINRDVVKVFITLCRIKSQRWATKALAAPRVIISRRVFERVQVDLCTPQGIPQSSEFKVIFHLRCHFSRFSWAKPQRTKSMSETNRIFENSVARLSPQSSFKQTTAESLELTFTSCVTSFTKSNQLYTDVLDTLRLKAQSKEEIESF